MNITFVRLKGVVRELAGIRHELSRLAECWERDLAENGIHMKPPKADKSGPEPTVEYTDEEMDWAAEQIEFLRRRDERLRAEEEEASGAASGAASGTGGDSTGMGPGVPRG